MARAVLFRVLLAAGVLGATAHMGITIQQPLIFPRSKATVYDAYRNPDLSASCHGTTAGAPVHTYKAGDTVTGLMTYGAAHGGGHCAWMISTDQQNWYKLNDLVDCTMSGAHNVVLPPNVPSACASTGCTLGWFWTPRLSGGCEIYHNCFDVVVTGATGGIETAASTVKYTPGAAPQCTRVAAATGRTPIYGTWIGPGGQSGGGGQSDGGGPAPAPTNVATPNNPNNPAAGPTPATTKVDVDALVNGCITYTVVKDDTLDKIKALFDLRDWPLLVEVNAKAYPGLEVDPDYIDVGWVLRVPQTGGAVKARSCDMPSPAPKAGGVTSPGAALAPATIVGALLSVWAVRAAVCVDCAV